MARFSWFGDTEHRVFNYKPIYYDQEAEERRKMFGKVDGSADKEAEKEEYVPGAHIHGAFRSGNYARKKGGNKVQTIIGLVTMLLIVIVLIFITKFYSLL